MRHADEPVGHCETKGCTGEMRVAKSEASKKLLVVWTWSDGGSSLEAVMDGLPQFCPRCGARPQ